MQPTPGITTPEQPVGTVAPEPALLSTPPSRKRRRPDTDGGNLKLLPREGERLARHNAEGVTEGQDDGSEGSPVNGSGTASVDAEGHQQLGGQADGKLGAVALSRPLLHQSSRLGEHPWHEEAETPQKRGGKEAPKAELSAPPVVMPKAAYFEPFQFTPVEAAGAAGGSSRPSKEGQEGAAAQGTPVKSSMTGGDIL